MHADQIVGFYDTVKVDNLRASNVLIDYLRDNLKDKPRNTVIIAPDAGGASRWSLNVRSFANVRFFM